MLNINTDLIGQLPPFYSKVKDYQAIMAAEEAQLEALADRINTIHDNYFPQGMDESTLTAWETLLGIASVGGETLEFRQQRLLSRISTNPPFSLQYLKNKLDEILGPGNSSVSIDYATQTMTISFLANGFPQDFEIRNLINQVKPAHIVDSYAAKFTDVSVVHAYKLGFGDFIGSLSNSPNYIRDLLSLVATYITQGQYVVGGVSGNATITKTQSQLTLLTITVTGFPSGTLTEFRFGYPYAHITLIAYTDLYAPVSSTTPITQKITFTLNSKISDEPWDSRFRSLLQLTHSLKEEQLGSVHITIRNTTNTQVVPIADFTMEQVRDGFTRYTYELSSSLETGARLVLGLYDTNENPIASISNYMKPASNVLTLEVYTGVTF